MSFFLSLIIVLFPPPPHRNSSLGLELGRVKSKGFLAFTAAPGKLVFLFLSSDVIAVLG